MHTRLAARCLFGWLACFRVSGFPYSSISYQPTSLPKASGSLLEASPKAQATSAALRGVVPTVWWVGSGCYAFGGFGVGRMVHIA